MCLSVAVAVGQVRDIVVEGGGQIIPLIDFPQIFDTGASHFILFPPDGERLGLRITNAPVLSRGTGGTVPAGITEECKVELWNKNHRYGVSVSPGTSKPATCGRFKTSQSEVGFFISFGAT